MTLTHSITLAVLTLFAAIAAASLHNSLKILISLVIAEIGRIMPLKADLLKTTRHLDAFKSYSLPFSRRSLRLHQYGFMATTALGLRSKNRPSPFL